MQITAYPKSASDTLFRTQNLIAMKLIAIFLVAAVSTLSARTAAQTVSITGKNLTLKQVFKQIENQTAYTVLYEEALVTGTAPVTLNEKNAPLASVLEKCLSGLHLTYTIKDKLIVIKEKEEKKPDPLTGGLNPRLDLSTPPPVTIHGKVINEKGEAVAGVTVTIKGTTNRTSTNDNGEFTITVTDVNATLIFSAITIETFETKLNGRTELALSAKTKTSELEEVVVNKGYYTEKQKLSTGNVVRVSGETINKQPVSDPLMALEGRVPGMYISQFSGIPGATTTIQIRGQNSLRTPTAGSTVDGNIPLYIVDGIPFAPSTLTSSFIGGGALGNPSNLAGNGGSPFNYLNPSDIESIEVLKDADATAIYGSRGANGVILINTKKGKSGKTRTDISISTGAGNIASKAQLMNTQQYLMIRREAYKNDAIVSIPANAYDINGTWDSTRYTDWQHLMIGGTAQMTNVQGSISGGSDNTQFLLSGTYFRQTTVYPGDYDDKKASVFFNLSHISSNQKFRSLFSCSYINDNSNLPGSDFTRFITLAPDAPSIYNVNGNLNWQGSTWTNPFAELVQNARASANNLIGNLNLSYELLPGLLLKNNMGYNSIQMNQTNTTPLTYFDPANNSGQNSRSNSFASSSINSWIIEPQINYSKKIGFAAIEALVGTTFQENTQNSISQVANGFTSDALISNVSSAASIKISGSTNSQYKYNALFGRFNVNWKSKYVINLTARRDGSSRFGSGKQFGNFASVGLGWIFTDENFIKKENSILSFGKFRVSYGSTGNDQIGDYKYLSSYSSNFSSYQGVSGLTPTQLPNVQYGWEVVRKSEAALDLGLLKDRIQLGIVYYENRTNNQLVGFALPSVSGFTSVQANLPALIQNSGWEFLVNTKNIHAGSFSWNTSFNLSIPQNKLLDYPNLSSSAYRTIYAIGQPLGVTWNLHQIGVNPQTGLFVFQDVDKDGTIGSLDNQFLKTKAQQYHGGFLNTLTYKGFSFDFFFQFVKQTGFNYFRIFGPNNPGSFGAFNTAKQNLPTIYLNRWSQPGDIASIQKVSTTANGNPRDGGISDASFIRLKNVSLSYTFSKSLLQKMHLSELKISVQGQNLLTITNYNGLDPETQNLSLPPLRMIVGRIQLSL